MASVAGRGLCPLNLLKEIDMVAKAKTDEEKLGKTISFRVIEHVYADFENQRKAANMTKSELFRDYIAQNKVQVIARPAPSRDAKRAVFLIQKTSNNINQLAHRANAEHLAGVLSEETFLAISNQLGQIATMLQDSAYVN